MFLCNAGDWKLDAGPFMIVITWQYNKICQFLVVDMYHLFIHTFKKNKHWKLDIIGYWVSRLLNWKGPRSQPQSSKLFKRFLKIITLCLSINWPCLVTLWVVIQKICSKMHPVSCTNTHHDVTDLVNHEIVKNTKTWISWEWNITFLQNEKIPNLCLRRHILKLLFSSGGNL